VMGASDEGDTGEVGGEVGVGAQGGFCDGGY